MRRHRPIKPKVFTCAEAARLLEVSRPTIYRWVQNRQLKSVTVMDGYAGEQMMIPRAEIERVLKEEGEVLESERATADDYEQMLLQVTGALVDNELDDGEKLDAVETAIFGSTIAELDEEEEDEE